MGRNELARISRSFEKRFHWLALATGPDGKSTTLECNTMKLYTRDDGLLALKKERREACKVAGVTVLGFGEHLPKDGILIADCRPRGFVGGRVLERDPAATMLYVGGVFKPEKTYYFESFERALKKAQKLAA